MANALQRCTYPCTSPAESKPLVRRCLGTYLYLNYIDLIMGIVDYEKKVESELRLLHEAVNNGQINKSNLKDILTFLDDYDVSPARKTIFLRHIRYFLKTFDGNAKSILKDRSATKEALKQVKKKLAPSTYAAVYNIVKRYSKWLFNGEHAESLKQDAIKPITKKKRKRKLNPDDMITWDEGLDMAKHTTSLQMKAIIFMQLDGGFRPGEFVDLCYGDFKQDKDMLIVNVKKGKTGQRSVLLWRSVPAVMAWLESHPSKKPNDPVWIVENKAMSRTSDRLKDGVAKYRYHSIRKRVMEIGEKAGINKPLDFYNFRHSSCVLDKKDNVPAELAAERHGHSLHHFTNTYGRMNIEEKADRIRKHYGIIDEVKEEKPKNQVCSRCSHVNEPNRENCFKCAAPLTMKKALELYEEKESIQKQIDELKAEQKQMQTELMNKILAEIQSK